MGGPHCYAAAARTGGAWPLHRRQLPLDSPDFVGLLGHGDQALGRSHGPANHRQPLERLLNLLLERMSLQRRLILGPVPGLGGPHVFDQLLLHHLLGTVLAAELPKDGIVLLPGFGQPLAGLEVLAQFGGALGAGQQSFDFPDLAGRCGIILHRVVEPLCRLVVLRTPRLQGLPQRHHLRRVLGRCLRLDPTLPQFRRPLGPLLGRPAGRIGLLLCHRPRTERQRHNAESTRCNRVPHEVTPFCWPARPIEESQRYSAANARHPQLVDASSRPRLQLPSSQSHMPYTTPAKSSA